MYSAEWLGDGPGWFNLSASCVAPRAAAISPPDRLLPETAEALVSDVEGCGPLAPVG